MGNGAKIKPVGRAAPGEGEGGEDVGVGVGGWCQRVPMRGHQRKWVLCQHSDVGSSLWARFSLLWKGDGVQRGLNVGAFFRPGLAHAAGIASTISRVVGLR